MKDRQQIPLGGGGFQEQIFIFAWVFLGNSTPLLRVRRQLFQVTGT